MILTWLSICANFTHIVTKLEETMLNKNVISRSVKFIGVFILFIYLSGCTSVGCQPLGDIEKTSVEQLIAKGKTTSDAIRAELGEPTQISFTDAGNQIWTYLHVATTPRLQNFIPYIHIVSSVDDAKQKELVIIFDENDVVKNFTMTESQQEIRRGIFPS